MVFQNVVVLFIAIYALAITITMLVYQSAPSCNAVEHTRLRLWPDRLTLEEPCNSSDGKIGLTVHCLLKDVDGPKGKSKSEPGAGYSDPYFCNRQGRRLVDQPGKTLVHTFAPHVAKRADTRKDVLLLLSFLATQPASSQLVLWHQAGEYPKYLDSLLPKRLLGEIEIKSFSAKEFWKIDMSSESKHRLFKEWLSAHRAGKTDIARFVILYLYGGIWIDTDSLLLRDLAPIRNTNFIYQVLNYDGTNETGFLNGAIMGTEGAMSQFIENMLLYVDRRLVMDPSDKNYFRWAESMFKILYQRNKENYPLLPGCLVDGGWFLKMDEPNAQPAEWGSFFSKQATESEFMYIDPRSAKSNAPFVYHWHGHWEDKIVNGSVADRADLLYRELLGIV